MTRTFEESYPLIFSISITSISTGICLYIGSSPKFNDTILDSGITVASIIIGFNAVYRNTLQTTTNKIIQSITNTSYMELYHRYLKAVTNKALLFVLVSFVILFLSESLRSNIISFNIWIFSASYMLLCFHRANSVDTILFGSK